MTINEVANVVTYITYWISLSSHCTQFTWITSRQWYVNQKHGEPKQCLSVSVSHGNIVCIILYFSYTSIICHQFKKYGNVSASAASRDTKQPFGATRVLHIIDRLYHAVISIILYLLVITLVLGTKSLSKIIKLFFNGFLLPNSFSSSSVFAHHPPAPALQLFVGTIGKLRSICFQGSKKMVYQNKKYAFMNYPKKKNQSNFSWFWPIWQFFVGKSAIFSPIC